MKKTFVVFVVCSVLGANLCLGTELGDSKNFESQVSLSQVDKEMLFGVDANQADVVLLSDEEMKATEGEGLFSWFGKLIPIKTPPIHVCMLCIKK